MLQNIYFLLNFLIKKVAQLFSLLIILINVSWSSNKHIRMISEESCDTEDRSNDAENTALIIGINDIFKYIQKENCYLTAIIFHNISVLLYFWLNKCTLMSIHSPLTNTGKVDGDQWLLNPKEEKKNPTQAYKSCLYYSLLQPFSSLRCERLMLREGGFMTL